MSNKILLILFILFVNNTIAQEGFGLGFHGFFGHSGIADQNAYGYTELDPKFNPSYGGGIVALYHFTDMLGASMEFNYAQAGGKWEGPEAKTTAEREVNLDYIQIPLLFRFRGKGEMTLYSQIGPQIGLLQTATQFYDPAESKEGRPNRNGDIKNRFTSTDVGVILDFGLQADITSNGIFATFGFRGYYGIGDINEKNFRIPNRKGVYAASHNMFAGLNLGILYRFVPGL